jgi:predicted dinucleotide-utilizing enzyme
MIDAAIVGLGRWGKTLVEAVQDKSDRLCFTYAVSRSPDKLHDYTATQQLDLVSGLEPVRAFEAIAKAVGLNGRALEV